MSASHVMSDGILIENVKLLESEEPLTRLAAIRRIRILLDEAETDAVRCAREADLRRSWDQIAVALGKTRWSVLRQFGPHGHHAVIARPPRMRTTEEPTVVDLEVGGESESAPSPN